MNDDANDTRQVLSVLRDRPVSVDSERLAARRTRVIAAITHEVAARATARRKRRWQRAASAALVLAAAASLLLGVQRFAARPSPSVSLGITFVGSVGETLARTSSGSRALRAGESLAQDPGRLETAASGSAELLTPAGLGLRLGNATRLSLAALLGTSSKNQVDLQQGELTCTVPHLQEGQRFAVQTPDARVVVHGTVFSVRVDRARALGQETCVEVTEGVVIVHHQHGETALNAGDRWGCESEPSAGLAISAEAPQPASSPPPKAAPARIVEHGTLARESELFQRALAAERLGQREQASALLGQLLSKYPGSPLAPEARRALSRVASPP